MKHKRRRSRHFTILVCVLLCYSADYNAASAATARGFIIMLHLLQALRATLTAILFPPPPSRTSQLLIAFPSHGNPLQQACICQIAAKRMSLIPHRCIHTQHHALSRSGDQDAVHLVDINNSRSITVNQAARLVIEKVGCVMCCIEIAASHFLLNHLK